ncbi:hypothetical protein SADUNF_Sadunf03G0125900 [Salix dunnii]|uniref:Uncharacterized protein n=1 Tax=Salix dunnii TaxID=1413687 RepID=A0A835N4J2_9ROSI|nr:hypothetical protein SADUNF_Sadunf03G0125900 [Salix dunnii]
MGLVQHCTDHCMVCPMASMLRAGSERPDPHTSVTIRTPRPSPSTLAVAGLHSNALPFAF